MASDERVATGALRLEAGVSLADGAMSAADAEAARRSGGLSMPARDGGVAYLEVGGVVVAEGRMVRRNGGSAFVVTKAYRQNGEERS